MSTTSDPTFYCVTCEAAIAAQPTFHVGLAFCCAGCVADGPCICSYDDEPLTRSDLEPVVAIDDRRRVTAAA